MATTTSTTSAKGKGKAPAKATSAKAPAKGKGTTTSKAPAKAPAAKGTGLAKATGNAAKVAKLRGAKLRTGGWPAGTPSWRACGQACTPPASPATARRLYDSVYGQGAHNGLVAGKGGRTVAQAS